MWGLPSSVDGVQSWAKLGPIITPDSHDIELT